MNGIPITIQIDGDTETLYLAPRASGEAGVRMAAAKAEFHRAEQAMAQHFQRVAVCAQLAMSLDATAADYPARILQLLDDQEAANAKALAERAKALAAATELVLSSLAANYGMEQAERYLITMTDLEINECVGIVETGEVPENFMQRRATPPNGNTTTRGDDGRSPSSSGTDLPEPSLSAERLA